MKPYDQVSEGLYLIRGKRSNIYLLTGEQPVLIDAGMPGDEAVILTALKDSGACPEQLQYIFITHAHLDHVGSLAAVKNATGARIVAGEREKDFLEGKKKLYTMRREGVGGKLFAVLLFFMERFMIPYQPVSVDIACTGANGGETIGEMKVIAAPGHSRGSLAYYHPGKRLLFTGDALSGSPCLRLPPRGGCCDYTTALESAAALSALDFDACLFGHGAPLSRSAHEQVRALVTKSKQDGKLTSKD